MFGWLLAIALLGLVPMSQRRCLVGELYFLSEVGHVSGDEK